MKNKLVAALLAFFLGGFGVHQFYLGNNKKGILYLLFFWTLIPAIIAFIDFIILITMSDEAFDLKYNKKELFKKEESYYPKSENEAITGLLLKIAHSDNLITEKECGMVVLLMKELYHVNVETESRYYNFGYVTNTNKYELIDKYINFVKDRVKLLTALISICLTDDNNVDTTEMEFIVYTANKSNIDVSNIDNIINDLKKDSELNEQI